MVMVMNAFTTESGLTLICPTTKLAYQPLMIWVRVIGSQRFTVSKCRHCDASGHIRQDPDFDPSNPQVHTHLLEREQ